MPKLPPINAKQLIQLLTVIGFMETRHRATSHIVFKHADGRRIVVAFHGAKDIPKGTLGGIIRDLGISRDEFLELLNK